ncbi:MAG: porin family protein [Thiovulaceae bacterium]|nr:porin family protein [Sulfurimonadaceae bacterium]MCW9025672.1 porin family protein [Sulfurimonadaceae bacterium]
MKIFLVLVFIFTLSYADRDGGPYLGYGYGISKYDSDGLYDSIKDEKANMQYFYGGAYINKHLSVELGYAKLFEGGYKIDESLKLNYTLYSVSTLAHYAFFDDIWDFYAKFGAGYTRLVGDEGFSFVYGVGTSIRFSELFSVKLAYDMYEFGYDSTQNGSADYKMRIFYPYMAVEFQF